MRSLFLMAAILFAGRAIVASDVPWLAEVQRPPENIPRPARPLVPLMSSAELDHSDALERWKLKRAELEKQWQEFLGPSPERPKSLSIEAIRTDELDGVSRKLIRYANEPGQTQEAYLLIPSPRPDQPLPGLVALHQTTNDTIDEIAGVKGPEQQHLALKLARQGFVVICPRNFLWHGAKDYQDAVTQFQAQHPGALGMRKMLYDAQRSVDILSAVTRVDPERIGAVGHSLGAKEVLYLMAFDNRIKAGVFSEGGIAFDSTNWDAPWYLGPKIKDDELARNHHELLGMIAPKPLLIIGGESGRGAADGDRSWPYVSAALPIYQLYGQPARIGLLNHRQGHNIPPAAFDRLAEWLTFYLGESGAASK
jgi:dienelactone hydrolase